MYSETIEDAPLIASATTVNVVVHIERLGPTYDADWTHFSLNLSAALQADPVTLADVNKFLSPWTWTWDTVSVLGVDANNMTVTLAEDAVEILLEQAPKEIKPLPAELEKEKQLVIDEDADLKPFRAAVAQPSERQTILKTQHHWKSFLLHAATFPAPLPQAQNVRLSVMLRIKSTELSSKGVVEIVAAPKFTQDPFGARGPELPPAGNPWNVTQQKPLRRVAKADISPSHYQWDYSAGSAADPSITASMNRCTVTLPPASADSLLDFETLWVNANSTNLPEDWTVRLEHTLADAFDIPRRLLDALHENLHTRKEQRTRNAWTVDDVFHAAFIASLRDLANHGLAEPPEGRRPSQTTEGRCLAKALMDGLPDHEKAIAMLKADERRYTSLKTWSDRVKAFVDDVEPISPFPEAVDATDLPGYARRLEHVYTVLATESNLRQFLLLEWDSALGSTAFWRQHRDTIATRIAGVQLRKRFALGNVGVAWRALSGNLHKSTELITALQGAYADYINGRFVTPPQSGYADYVPPTGNAPVNVLPHLLEYAKTFVTRAVMPLAPDAANDEPGTLREDLVIQVDRLQREAPDGDATDHDDFLRRIAGVGVLLRRRANPVRPWRCLNLANVVIGEQASGAGPVPVPLRLGYRSGLRSSFVSYLNEPMAAKSPSTALSNENEFVPTDPDDRLPLLVYENPYTPAQNLQLEGLIYGESYEAAVFMIGNAGHLPEALTSVDGNGRKIPWKFRSPSSDPPNIQTIAYKRRVPVGCVRLFSRNASPDEKGEVDRLPVPPIPASVLPLARSRHSVDITTQESDREDPLVLLTPKDDRHWPANRDRFEFGIRPPSAPLDVWDRWVAIDASADMKQKRARVRARYYERTDVPQDGGDKASRPDSTIDDPAVEKVQFTISRLYPSTGAATTVQVSFDPPPTNKCDATLRCVQAPAIPVEIFSSAKFEPPQPGAKPVKIGIPAGEVWRVEMAPMIAGAGRFHVPPAGVGRPVTLVVEVADLLFTEKDQKALATRLHAALKPEHAPDLDDALKVSLHLPAVSGDRFRDRFHRVDVLLQRWRWDGRPLLHFTQVNGSLVPRYRFPMDTPAAKLEAYDGTLFASRESTDHLEVPARVDFVAPAAPSAPILFTTPLSTLPGALYFRSAVRVFSRYEGLLKRDDSLDSRLATTTSSAEAWQRLVVPCRWHKPVPRPVVKLVLPLTSATKSSVLSATEPLEQGGSGDTPTGGTSVTKSPGVLVVLDEGWYSDTLGGVAEVFEWDVARVALPDLESDSRLQIGADPVLDLSDDPLAGREISAHEAIGAIGYTHDTGTAAPLFTHSSFVIPPPSIEGGPDLSWFFLKLRFRRSIDRGNSQGSVASLWTAPVWCQLIPPSDCIRVGTSLLGMASVGVKGSDGSFFKDNDPNQPIVPQPTSVASNSRSLFSLWALVTRPVVDGLGRANQEAYQTIERLTGGRFTPVPRGHIVRVVEVQERCPPGNDADCEAKSPIKNAELLFAALFPGDAETDAKARVVRVTPPIVAQ